MLSSNNGNAPLCILVVEDQDGKYNDILGAISDSDIQSPLLERAKNVVDAEDSIISRTWDLLVLDISMDISPGSLGPLRGGHANLGGLDIIEQMYLLDVSIPTIIITGFDYFQTFDDGLYPLLEEFSGLRSTQISLVEACSHNRMALQWKIDFVAGTAESTAGTVRFYQRNGEHFVVHEIIRQPGAGLSGIALSHSALRAIEAAVKQRRRGAA